MIVQQNLVEELLGLYGSVCMLPHREVYRRPPGARYIHATAALAAVTRLRLQHRP